MSEEDRTGPRGLTEGTVASSTSLRRRDAARGFATLLVSDIRLYHEEEVFQGRLHRDLARRLGGPIETARARHVRRFPETDAMRIFDEELLRILASGDASALL